MFELWSETRKCAYPTQFESYQIATRNAEILGEDWKPRKIRVVATWQEREAKRLADKLKAELAAKKAGSKKKLTNREKKRQRRYQIKMDRLNSIPKPEGNS